VKIARASKSLRQISSRDEKGFGDTELPSASSQPVRIQIANCHPADIWVVAKKLNEMLSKLPYPYNPDTNAHRCHHLPRRDATAINHDMDRVDLNRWKFFRKVTASFHPSHLEKPLHSVMGRGNFAVKERMDFLLISIFHNRRNFEARVVWAQRVKLFSYERESKG
jgi:hypothetical protein